jgi:hypothetical protein
MARGRFGAALIAVLLMAGVAFVSPACNFMGPSESLAGTWEANYGGKFGFLGIILEQSGDQITGIACGSNSGTTLFRNVPVRGEYPDVRFDVASTYVEPCCLSMTGSRFAGRRDSSGDIVGVFNNTDVRFRKTANPVCR